MTQATTQESEIRERIVGGDQVILVGDRVLVASQTTPHTWYDVSGGTCQCRGFAFRSQCRHIIHGQEALKAAEPTPFRVPTGRDALRLTMLPDD